MCLLEFNRAEKAIERADESLLAALFPGRKQHAGVERGSVIRFKRRGRCVKDRREGSGAAGLFFGQRVGMAAEGDGGRGRRCDPPRQSLCKGFPL